MILACVVGMMFVAGPPQVPAPEPDPAVRNDDEPGALAAPEVDEPPPAAETPDELAEPTASERPPEEPAPEQAATPSEAPTASADGATPPASHEVGPRDVEPGSQIPPTADPFSQASDYERAPTGHDEESGEMFDRRGVQIGLGLGVTHCAQGICDDIAMGGVGRLEVGYRFPLIAVVATTSYGGAPVAGEGTGAREAVRFLDVVGGLQLFPVRHGRVDPFVGFGIGYARTAVPYDTSTTTSIRRQYSKRGALMFSGGLMWQVGPRFALGGRVTARLPFLGEWCTDSSIGGIEDDASCIDIREDLEDSGEGRSKRSQRRAYPRPWAATFDIRFTL